MRDSLLVSGLVLVAVAGIYLLWRSNPDAFRSHLYAASATTEPAPAKPAPPPAVVKPRRAILSVPPEPIAEAPVVAEAVIAPPRPAPVVVPDPPPFPTADRIATGLLKDKVTTAYGGPAISAVTSADGHMVETMIYAQKGGRSETVIRLDEGKVSSSYTKLTVAPAAGMSVPRPRFQP